MMKPGAFTTECTEHTERGCVWEDVPSTLKKCPDDLVEQVIGAAIEVHRELGPGLLESIYERALMLELTSRGIEAEAQVEVPVQYKGNELGLGFRADMWSQVSWC